MKKNRNGWKKWEKITVGMSLQNCEWDFWKSQKHARFLLVIDYLSSDKEFLPERNNFSKFFLPNDLKWFILSWYLRNWDFGFLFWIQEKNVRFKWIRWTTRKSVLAQTRDTSMAHSPDTRIHRLIVWLSRLKCTSKLIHWHATSPWPFHHGFWTNLILLNKKIIQKWFYSFFGQF